MQLCLIAALLLYLISLASTLLPPLLPSLLPLLLLLLLTDRFIGIVCAFGLENWDCLSAWVRSPSNLFLPPPARLPPAVCANCQQAKPAELSPRLETWPSQVIVVLGFV